MTPKKRTEPWPAFSVAAVNVHLPDTLPARPQRRLMRSLARYASLISVGVIAAAVLVVYGPSMQSVSYTHLTLPTIYSV